MTPRGSLQAMFDDDDGRHLEEFRAVGAELSELLAEQDRSELEESISTLAQQTSVSGGGGREAGVAVSTLQREGESIEA